MNTYRIRNWNTHFENGASLQVINANWVKMPNRFDGKGYRRVTRLPNAVNVMLGWFLLVEIASKMPRRGVLADEDGALTAEDFADMTNFPATIFEETIEALVKPDIKWIELESDIHASTPRVHASTYTCEEVGKVLKVGKGKEGTHTPQPPKGEELNNTEQVPMGFEKFWTVWPQHRRKTARSQCLRKWTRGGCEVIAEQVIAALQRCKASGDWLKNQGEFIPAPLTWINQRRWEAPAELLQSDVGVVSDAEAYPGQSDEILRAADAMVGGVHAH